MSTGVRWSQAEDAIVVANVATMPVREMASLLPGRTLDAIGSRIRTLKLRRMTREWTGAEERRLWASWGVDLRVLARQLCRSVGAVYYKARELGLTLGCPEGFESFTSAAARTGYLRSQLATIMMWAGYRRRVRLTYDRAERHQGIVDSFEVDDAVERWTEYLRTTETIAESARRLGTNHHRVREAIARAGVALPPRPRRGCHWRVPISVVDAALSVPPSLGTGMTHGG